MFVAPRLKIRGPFTTSSLGTYIIKQFMCHRVIFQLSGGFTFGVKLSQFAELSLLNMAEAQMRTVFKLSALSASAIIVKSYFSNTFKSAIAIAINKRSRD